MATRKRAHDQVYSSIAAPPSDNLLTQLRNSWELPNLMQYIFIFGKAVRIDDDLDMEGLERACLDHESSTTLNAIGLALLKMVSSHRGITPELFNEQARKQFISRAPTENPFGEEAEVKTFDNFDVWTKLRVLVKLSQWTWINADRMRERLEERTETDQAAAWRVDEIGKDKAGGAYFVLDDNRLYRRESLDSFKDQASIPQHMAKKKTKPKAKPAPRKGSRRSARQSGALLESDHDETMHDVNIADDNESSLETKQTPAIWSCVAIKVQEYRAFLDTIKGSKSAPERALHDRISTDVMPVMEREEAAQERKRQKAEREMINIQRLAGAKRSSRLEAKILRDREEREEQEARAKAQEAQKAQELMDQQRRQFEYDRNLRLHGREQRLKEREMKRSLHKEELSRLAEEEKKVDAGDSRASERRLKAEKERNAQILAELEQENWFFDCSKCGVFGDNLGRRHKSWLPLDFLAENDWHVLTMNQDDGTHSVACEKCEVWQHSACLGIPVSEIERDDFHFTCQNCRQREQDEQKPKIPNLKFSLNSSKHPNEGNEELPHHEKELVPSKHMALATDREKTKPISPITNDQSADDLQAQAAQQSSQHVAQNGFHEGVFQISKPLNTMTPFTSSSRVPSLPAASMAIGNQQVENDSMHQIVPKGDALQMNARSSVQTQVANDASQHLPRTLSYEDKITTAASSHPAAAPQEKKSGLDLASALHKDKLEETNDSTDHGQLQHSPGWSARYVVPSTSQQRHNERPNGALEVESRQAHEPSTPMSTVPPQMHGQVGCLRGDITAPVASTPLQQPSTELRSPVETAVTLLFPSARAQAHAPVTSLGEMDANGEGTPRRPHTGPIDSMAAPDSKEDDAKLLDRSGESATMFPESGHSRQSTMPLIQPDTGATISPRKTEGASNDGAALANPPSRDGQVKVNGISSVTASLGTSSQPPHQSILLPSQDQSTISSNDNLPMPAALSPIKHDSPRSPSSSSIPLDTSQPSGLGHARLSVGAISPVVDAPDLHVDAVMRPGISPTKRLSPS